MKVTVASLGLATLVVSTTAFSPLLSDSSRRITSLAATAGKLETITVKPIKSLDGIVTLPGSKSLSNRCLLLAALSEGNTRVENLLESDDIRYMLEALDHMKVPVERINADTVIVTGQAGPINAPSNDICELYLGNAGTAMRPLAAALCMGQGKFVLDGVARMRERPIADLIDGLQQLGAKVTCVEETGCPPVTIDANGLKGGKVSVRVVFLTFVHVCICAFCFSPLHPLLTTGVTPSRHRLAVKCRRSSCPLF
jgi:3-phosphoshikimate 1-carboxyvinyltransferase